MTRRFEIPSTIHAHMGCTRTQDGDDMSERDIVERLRADERYGDLDLYHEAADEIERLREKVETARSLGKIALGVVNLATGRDVMDGVDSEPTADLTHAPSCDARGSYEVGSGEPVPECSCDLMPSRPRGQGGLRHISDILTDITQADEPPPPHKIKRHPFNRHCPCAECMRVYLASVEPVGDRV